MTDQTRDDLAAENANLRALLSACKPYVVHNGLRIRMGALGIDSDPEFVTMADDARTALVNRGRQEAPMSLNEESAYVLGVESEKARIRQALGL